MHKTLHNDVKGNIDSKVYDTTVRGWCFHKSMTKNLLRVMLDEIPQDVQEVAREDVSTFYNKDLTFCGWSFERKLSQPYRLEMCVDFDWIPIFEETARIVVTSTTKVLPSFLVVDNFYENPDSVRSFALQQPLSLHPKNHKGIRSDTVYRFPGLKERFETLLGTPIVNWEGYGTNGCFQVNIAGEQAVYHSDSQTYAGVIFLTPNAPGNAGTQFFRSKETGVRKPDDTNHSTVFRGGFYDSTPFEKLDVVGNTYNRLVLFDAKMIHAADTYFGKEINDGRLIQLFFFDV